MGLPYLSLLLRQNEKGVSDIPEAIRERLVLAIQASHERLGRLLEIAGLSPETAVKEIQVTQRRLADAAKILKEVSSRRQWLAPLVCD